ncbi:MAG: 50S ribosomal protein L31 [Candidatus Doudnabacteria bacterium RIFCSPHIGHO2_02_FULL_46_11]|uniref:50S ribosomal protein L31 n=1 Tax=Candidatus Doudnabacteria bacterium RIFCSPHIGHO2_02_FULL_46_11 TaxID=1817832 RepID=A0A1F5P827_9BACT|nr:MAG: 50S ribosomal protein L31 [Candidatus Doudnabacteria bacterium RIFCSPHIGHO2_02_FULL_46_11]
MKQSIHPQYYKDAVISCACGNQIVTGSTVAKMQVEICAVCHPYYTGEERLVDTRGRVEKFRARAAKAVEPKTKKVRVRKTKEA